jgi:hypothetical protein
MRNVVVDEAWQTLRAKVIAHGERTFRETGTLETVIDLNVCEIDSRTARVSVHLASGAIVSVEFDLWAAATAQGFDLAAVECFGSDVRPN